MSAEILLQTERLYLRRLTIEDAGLLFELDSDPKVMRFYPAPYSRQVVEAFLAAHMERYEKVGYSAWLVEEKAGGQPVGRIGLCDWVVEGVEVDTLKKKTISEELL